MLRLINIIDRKPLLYLIGSSEMICVITNGSCSRRRDWWMSTSKTTDWMADLRQYNEMIRTFFFFFLPKKYKRNRVSRE